MTTYFQYNERRTRKPPKKTEHGTEIVDIPDVMVTEEAVRASEYAAMVRACREVSRRAKDRGQTHIGFARHDWMYCPCAKCRIDRGEDEWPSAQ